MVNINEEYINEYIRMLLPMKESLKIMENYAEENHVPIIQPEVAQLLRILLKINKPKNILEIGTAIGYSAIIMANNTSKETKIISIERRNDMVKLAEENIKKHDYSNKIEILEGDAIEVIPTLKNKYDFIFLDAAKGHYMDFFTESMNLLEVGGIIVSDNVLFKGMVASDNLVIRRKKTIVKRLREFLRYINEIEGYTSSVIPIGDGLAITYKEE